MTNNVRRFDKTDWCGFAGATTFADGSDPFIGEVTLDGIGLIIIGDVGGISLIHDGDSHFEYRMFDGWLSPLKPDMIQIVMEHICTLSTVEQLLALGFTKVEL